MTRKYLTAFIVLLILILLSVWIAQKVTVSYEDHRRAPETQIRNNPFSALVHLLRSRDIPAETRFNRKLLNDLPSTDSTLVLTNIHQPLLPSETEALNHWVSAGGYLVYEIPDILPYDEDNLQLNEQFGITSDYPEDNEADVSHASFTIDGSTGYVYFDDSWHILNSANDKAEPVFISEAGVHAYTLAQDAGRITFITDSSFMRTPRVWRIRDTDDEDEDSKDEEDYVSLVGLSEYDHAYLSTTLLSNESGVWFIFDTGSSSLAELIYRHFPMTTVFSLAWLILLFVYLLRRFGPQNNQESSNQQNLKAHIYQSGQFHWRMDKASYLLNLWRQKLLRRLRQRHAQLSGLEDDIMAEKLSAQTGFTQEQISAALHGNVTGKTDLQNQVVILRALWKL